MKKSMILLSLIVCFGCGVGGNNNPFPNESSKYQPFAPDKIPFVVADSTWDVDGFGNHRAVVRVNKTYQHAVKVVLPWRRADLRPETKKIVVVEASTKKEMTDVCIIEFSSERGVIAFRPEVVEGTYYVYYLPYKFRTGWNDARYGKPWNDYLPSEYAADEKWAATVKNNLAQLPEAKVERFESRTKFDFFTSMGLIATAKETDSLKKSVNGDFALFPEDRAFPIKLTSIPARWGAKDASRAYEGYALRNEYYTWQIGVWATSKDLKNVRLRFGDFTDASRENIIPAGNATCFNQEGTNWDGKSVSFNVNVPYGKVQALWCGLQVPETAKAGIYKGKVVVSADNAASREVDVTIHVGNGILTDKGDGDLWRHSRLRWLNSTIGTDSLPVTPYQNMKIDGNKISATGKEVVLAANGLPQSIAINGRKILERPMAFVIVADNKKIVFDASNLKIQQAADGLTTWHASSVQDGLRFDCESYMEYDGRLHYHVRLSSDRPLNAKDIRLETVYTPDASKFFMGTGFKGGLRPENYEWDWKGPWDSYWTGDYDAGLHVEFLGDTYHGPLLNDYKPLPPAAWANEGKGRIIAKGLQGEPTQVIASTGNATVTDRPLNFEFAMLITPVKPLNPAKHFSERYIHAELDYFDKGAAAGANIDNLHHATKLNPVINYPFTVRDSLIAGIKKQHTLGRKVKLYYTIRELTNHTVEIHALKSLNHEIFVTGAGYGLPWHCEHLIDDYRPAWYTELPNQTSDAALVLNGFSRWINYYLEGLRWMFENYEIDGIYMDDVSFDGEVMKRMRKIIAKYRPSALIDLHSNTGYSIGPANQYTYFFPYVDRIWFGESFRYNEMMPDEWFVTFSGIPFGVMGEMLQDGGNRWLGMVYGTTARHGWGVNNEPVWSLWKSFGIEKAEMIGYWQPNCPIKTDNSKVKATAYVRSGKTLISIGNFDSEDHSIHLSFDWEKLGIKPDNAILHAPEIKDFQTENTFQPNAVIQVKAKQGWLLILENK
ncbi:hypothetical protein FACS189452_04870 [Bacteroidia bacterium]|nr:hypothetical protein FACS189452_04870 [Bacteroidia bacterium]